MVRVIVSAVVLLVLACSTGPDRISQNHKTSECGGFVGLGKAVEFTPEDIDSAEYCSAEKLRWSYRENDHVLELYLTRRLMNCAVKPEMSVTQGDGRYTISVEDKNDPKVKASCMCYFDLYCEVAVGKAENLTVEFEGNSHEFDLSQSVGSSTVDTSSNWQCRGSM